MKRPKKRQRLLISAACLALVGWLLDSALRDGPTEAQAGSSTDGTRQTVRWQDISGLIERYTHVQYESLARELAALDRDLFVPTPAITARLFERPIDDDGEAEQAAAERAAFSDRHRLTGVVLGRQPLAVIDGQVVRSGDRLDGHHVLEVQRDSVVLECDITKLRVVLSMEDDAWRAGLPPSP